MLRAQVGETPGPGPVYPKVLSFGDRRAVSQYKLDMVAPGAWHIVAGEGHRMIWSGNWDQFDGAHGDAVDPRADLIERPTHSYRRSAADYHMHHRPQRLHVKAQRYCGKLGAECL